MRPMTTPGRAPSPTLAILAIFLLSGAAGLVYEIVWSRQLVLVFGNTTQAVSAILTGFFGGMAIGAAVGGRIADRVRSPLRMYGLLELALVVVVLVTPISFRLIHEVYRGIYPSLEGAPQVLAIVRLILAVAALAPATILMGATFPSLTRYLARSSSLSRVFGRLYAANTLGAIVGTLAAGLVLIEILGLSGALAIGASCSAVAGLAALWLSRGDASARSEPKPPVRTTTASEATGSHGSVSALPARVRLALVIAFISGLTSLAYQVTWTRLLASGTGNTTYVFTAILAVFLVGIAIGALIFNVIRPHLGDPVRLLAITQIVVAALALIGLVGVLGQPRALNPGEPIQTLRELFGSGLLVVLPVTIVLGIAFPTASALLRDDASAAGAESGSLLASNTAGAIVGALLVPFFLIPSVGSPWVVVILAAVNASVGIGLAFIARPRRLETVALGAGVLAVVGLLVIQPAIVAQPNEAFILSSGGRIFASTEDEIASVQAGQIRATPELWVAGTSMTLLTVDAKLMPILPLIARPDSKRALVVAFGMGTAFRAALIAGLRTDAIELVPSVPDMFGFYYPDADAFRADSKGRVVIADGRNHLELATERFDIIVTDPPPPIESSGASVISSLEYYRAGHDHLTPSGVMMQWVPFGAPEADFKDHVRTFASVFPNVAVIRGAGGYGAYMLGSDEPMTFEPDAIRAILARPGILEDISSAYDSPAATVEEWISVIARQQWLDGPAVAAYAGDGPLITDDHPRPEYFLLRRLYGLK
jgi:spermidine synthase